MIERLEQLTMAQFIDLVGGDTSVLLGKHEVAPESKKATAMRNIILEYREIADPGGTTTYLSTAEELVKAKMELSLFIMCDNIVAMGAYDNAREVLETYGISAAMMSDKRVAAEVTSRIGRTKREIDRIEKERQSGEEVHDIRRSFDEQTASMMVYFKFQIDTASIRATIYAHLVARFNREVKAQIAAMKNR